MILPRFLADFIKLKIIRQINIKGRINPQLKISLILVIWLV